MFSQKLYCRTRDKTHNTFQMINKVFSLTLVYTKIQIWISEDDLHS